MSHSPPQIVPEPSTASCLCTPAGSWARKLQHDDEYSRIDALQNRPKNETKIGASTQAAIRPLGGYISPSGCIKYITTFS